MIAYERVGGSRGRRKEACYGGGAVGAREVLRIRSFRQEQDPNVRAKRFAVSRTTVSRSGRNLAVLFGLDLGLFLVGSVGEHLQQHFAPPINPLDQNTGAFVFVETERLPSASIHALEQPS